jgi:hypothetical protein
MRVTSTRDSVSITELTPSQVEHLVAVITPMEVVPPPLPVCSWESSTIDFQSDTGVPFFRIK